jgi:hypothetical protein
MGSQMPKSLPRTRDEIIEAHQPKDTVLDWSDQSIPITHDTIAAQMRRAMRILLMAAGGLAIIWFIALYFLGGMCQGPVLQSLTTGDGSVKASLYESDCGAMTARRTIVALSAPYVDGRRYGDPVVTLLSISGSSVHLTWRTNRDLAISYPASTDVEYAVSKTRGVKIYLQPGPP